MPGSLLTYTIDKSLRHGVKAGILIIIGHGILEIALITLIILGLGKYLETQTAQISIGLLGGLLLFYFSYTMIMGVRKSQVNVDVTETPESKAGNLILGGALVSAANPYFFIWWAVIGLGLIMASYTAFGVIGVIFFYLGHISADSTWYITISAIIGKTRNFMSRKVYNRIIIFLALCLIAFGLKFFISSLIMLL